MNALIFLLTLLGGPASASPEPSCANPRAAADSLLAWLQPERYEPIKAATCLDLPPELADEGPRLAVQLKTVLDARGYYVPVSELPTDPDHRDEDGLARVEPVRQLPEVTLEKVGDRWLWSADTMRAVPRLYADSFSGLGAWFQGLLPANLSTLQVRGVHLWQLTLALVLLAAGALLARLLNAFLLARLEGLARRSDLAVDPRVFQRTRRPTVLLVLSMVLSWGIPELQLGIHASRALLFGVRIAMSVAAVVILMRWIDVFVGLFTERARRTESRMDDQVAPLLGQAGKGAAVALGVVFVLNNMGVDVASLIAGLGIGGLAVALAAQETLANIFGSVMIFVDRPFHVGDWVVLDNGVEGTVEEVGFRSTRIRTFYNSVVVLPNAKVANGRVDNMGMRRYRRFKTTLALTYDTPPEKLQAFVEGVRAAIQASGDTRKDYYEVHFKDMSASSLDVMVYCFLDVPDWHQELVARSRLLMEFLRLARDLDVRYAYPSQSVYLEATPEHPLPPQAPGDAAALAGVVRGYGPGGDRARPAGPFITEGFNAGMDSARGDSGK